MLNDEKRGVEEQYTSAMSTSDLRVEAERKCDADIIIASGWSQGRIGGALMRLHTEYDASEKPRALTFQFFLPLLVEAAAATAKDGKVSKEDMKRLKRKAQMQAHDFNLNQLGRFLERLKSLPDVRTQMTIELVRRGVTDAETAGVEILRWWLHQTCPVCNGTKFQAVEGTSRHNGKACPQCQGTGKSDAPHHQVGRALASWMDQCRERHRATLGRFVNGRQKVEAARSGRRVDSNAAQPRIFLRPAKKVVAQA
jgi:hypothetical protein